MDNASTNNKLKRLQCLDCIKIMVQSRSDRETDPDLQVMWGDHWVKQELIREFQSFGLDVVDRNPDAVLHFFGSPAKKPPPAHTFNMVWLYSHPDQVTPENLRVYDRIFCSSPDFITRLNNMGYENVELMYACTSKTPLDLPMRYDVIFLGNARKTRADGRSIIGHLGKPRHNLKVWGNLWETILPSEYIGGRYWDYRNLEELYASAGITLNDHNHDMAREGFISNKVFDILASGGFVISDFNKGIEGLFGDSVPQYQNPDHLRQLIDFYLGNPDERERLKRRGAKIALQHTYSQKALQFIRAMGIAAEFSD